jgi:peptide/nickel transport system permease protein
VRTRPPRIAPWLLPIAAVAGSAPAFFIAAICLALLTRLAINQPAGATPPLPLQGFGWDRHMILPLIALIPRPAAQLAQLVAALLVEELSQQHVVAAAARGVGWQTIRRRHAFRNILAPVIAAAAGTLRLLAGEVVLVEWLFGWPGLGRLLALTLLPPSIATVGGLRGARPEYLDPELLALTVTVFAAIFLAVDLIAAVASRAADPRLREPELQAAA